MSIVPIETAAGPAGAVFAVRVTLGSGCWPTDRPTRPATPAKPRPTPRATRVDRIIDSPLLVKAAPHRAARNRQTGTARGGVGPLARPIRRPGTSGPTPPPS